MPFNRCPHHAEATSSRKRSHAEMLQSQSRSQSPGQPSSKRQRTSATPSTSFLQPNRRSRDESNESFSLMLPQLSPARFEGDGLDFRRPSIPIAPPSAVIDLTADDSPPSEPELSNVSRWPRRDRLALQRQRGPRFQRNILSDDAEVIDLLHDSDDTEDQIPDIRTDEAQRRNFATVNLSDSPEVQFISERRARSPSTNGTAPRPGRRLPTPQPTRRPMMPNLGLGEILRRSSNFLFPGNEFEAGPVQSNVFERVDLDRIDGIEPRLPRGQPFGVLNAPEQLPGDVYGDFVDLDELELNYEHPAFHIGGPGFLEVVQNLPVNIQQMHRGSTPPEVVKEPYKQPPACKVGFTRNFEEETYLECPSCYEELAVGDSDLKQQVWMSKQCGHVYCGVCATNRALTKHGKKGKAAAQKTPQKPPPFKACLVPDCGRSVISKTAMVQIYL